MEPGEVGLVEVGSDDAVSSSPLLEDEQRRHEMPQTQFPVRCSLPRFDFWPNFRNGHDDSGFSAQCKANPNVEVDVSEEVEYLKNEDEQWRTNSMRYKGFFDDVPQSSSKPVNAKTFKTYDHRRHLASSHRKALIRAEIMSEVVNDIYRTHKMPMNKERTFTFEYDKEDDENIEGVVQWKRKHGQPISLFALSANQCKGVKWLMDTGCGHDLIGKSKAASLGVDIVQDKDKIVFQTANGTTSTADSIKYYVNELKETVQPFVLDETPTVLSIGRRCMKMGYSFHWICGK